MRLVVAFVTLAGFVAIGLGVCGREAFADNPIVKVLPKSLSQLDGFEGIVVKRGFPCPECCWVVIPDGFGRSDSARHQRDLLRSMAFGEPSTLRLDVDCPALWSYDALEHLLYLANTHHELWAIRALLAPSGPEMDGELAEEYEDMYLIPTLLGLDAPLRNLGLQREKLIIQSICGWMQVHNDKRRLMRVIRHLQGISMTRLATGLENCGGPPPKDQGKGN